MSLENKTNLNEKSLDELRGLAAKHKLSKYRNLRKEDLIRLIEGKIQDDSIEYYFSDPNNSLKSNRPPQSPKFIQKLLPATALVVSVTALFLNPSVKDYVLDKICGDNIGYVVISGKPVGSNRYIPEFSFHNNTRRTVRNVLIRFNKNSDKVKFGDVSAHLMTSFTEVGIIRGDSEPYNFHIRQNNEIYFQQIYVFNQVNEMPAMVSRLFKYDLKKNNYLYLDKYNIDDRKDDARGIRLEWISD